VLRNLKDFIAQHDLLRPGDRVGVAVSGGADSVALLRALLESRSELGIVLSLVHFNHKLRGEESDTDEQFVLALAHKFDLPFHHQDADTRRYAREKELSLEAAARDLRYGFFGRLISERRLDKVATAHTLDDQAETVLLRMFRGTGTSGLAGILPRLKLKEGAVVRPFLSTRRREITEYLRQVDQPWREDSSNAEATYTRNRVRHQLIPLLEESFNPQVVEGLSNLAEIARVEDEYWAAQTAEAFVRCHRNHQLDLNGLLTLHKALQRRVLRLAAIQAGANLDFEHTERILHLVQSTTAGERTIELPGGFKAVLEGNGLRFKSTEPKAKPCGFAYRLQVPGEIAIPELNLLVRAKVLSSDENTAGYNDDRKLALHRLTPDLMIRNWRPGDRFRPVHTRSEKKVKELLQERRVPTREKALWPVALAGDTIVWMRGFPVSALHIAGEEPAVVIEELLLSPNSLS
jgi:tRNA(Ile)-lysidine synthase